MSLDPRIWGPDVWKVLTRFAFEYPANPTATERQRAHDLFTDWIYSLMYCDLCAPHWRNLMVKHPPLTQSAATLSRWYVQCRNEVNARLGKPVWLYEDVLQQYLKEKNRLIAYYANSPPSATTSTATAPTPSSFMNSTVKALPPKAIAASIFPPNQAPILTSQSQSHSQNLVAKPAEVRLPFDVSVSVVTVVLLFVLLVLARSKTVQLYFTS